MVNVTVIGPFVGLVKLPVIGDPEPLAGIPVTVATLSLTQVKTVPGTPGPALLHVIPDITSSPVFAQPGPLGPRTQPLFMVAALQLTNQLT